jgi:hypothetical protein
MELVTVALVNPGDPVNVGGVVELVTVGANGLVSMVIRHDEDDIGRSFCCCSVGCWQEYRFKNTAPAKTIIRFFMGMFYCFSLADFSFYSNMRINIGISQCHG